MVMAIELDDSHWVSTERSFNVQYWKSKWHAVPKPDHEGTAGNGSEWISSYADIERMFLNDLHKLKSMIRIFKVNI